MRTFDKKKIKLFELFIENSGAEMLTTTNEWEILRFRANGETGVVYKNKLNHLTFVGQAQNALDSFLENKSYSAQEKQRRTKKSTTVKSLLKRDGDCCFYCEKVLNDNETIEHLLSIKHGGNNHIANMVLAHHECNQKAASMVVIDKVKLRESLKGK